MAAGKGHRNRNIDLKDTMRYIALFASEASFIKALVLKDCDKECVIKTWHERKVNG